MLFNYENLCIITEFDYSKVLPEIFKSEYIIVGVLIKNAFVV
jgi:hypothetical protein